MPRPDLIALAGALVFVSATVGGAAAQTPPSVPPEETREDAAVGRDPDPADKAALDAYEQALEAWGNRYADWLDQDAVAFAYSIPEGIDRLHLVNTSATDVTCTVHRGGVSTGRVIRIPSGHATYMDGPPSDMTDVSLMAAYIPIPEVQLRCPLVAGNALHGNFGSGRRYVIQRAAGGGLVLVEVVANGPH